jgi:hypothetical protein
MLAASWRKVCSWPSHAAACLLRFLPRAWQAIRPVLRRCCPPLENGILSAIVLKGRAVCVARAMFHVGVLFHVFGNSDACMRRMGRKQWDIPRMHCVARGVGLRAPRKPCSGNVAEGNRTSHPFAKSLAACCAMGEMHAVLRG